MRSLVTHRHYYDNETVPYEVIRCTLTLLGQWVGTSEVISRKQTLLRLSVGTSEVTGHTLIWNARLRNNITEHVIWSWWKDAEIRCDQIDAVIISNLSDKSSYLQDNIFCHKTTYFPNRDDNAQGKGKISNLLADIFQNLYNCVSYLKKEDMDAL